MELMLTPDGTPKGVLSTQIGEKVGWDGNPQSTLTKLQSNGIDAAVPLSIKNLKDQEIVSLRFRRLENRLNWEEGTIVTSPVEEETGRAAYVEKSAFVHHERFLIPGEVEK